MMICFHRDHYCHLYCCCNYWLMAQLIAMKRPLMTAMTAMITALTRKKMLLLLLLLMMMMMTMVLLLMLLFLLLFLILVLLLLLLLLFLTSLPYWNIRICILPLIQDLNDDTRWECICN